MDFSKKNAKFTVSVNDVLIGLTESVKVQKLYDKETEAMQYEIVFKRRLPQVGNFGEPDFFTSESLKIAISEQLRKITFSACTVESVLAEYTAEGEIYETVTLHTALKNRAIS